MLSKKLQGAGGQGPLKLEPFSAHYYDTTSFTLPSNLPLNGILVLHSCLLAGGSGLSVNTPSGWTKVGQDVLNLGIAGRQYTTAHFKKIDSSDAGAQITDVLTGSDTFSFLYVFDTGARRTYTLGGAKNNVATYSSITESRQQASETAPYFNLSCVATFPIDEGGQVQTNSGLSVLRANDLGLCEYQLVNEGTNYPDLVVTNSPEFVDAYHVFQIQVS